MRALAQLRNHDLVEEWLPDALRHEDELSNPHVLVNQARSRLANNEYGRPREAEVPKTAFFSRPGRLLELADRLALHVVVSSIAELIDDAMTDSVYSARTAHGAKYLLRRGTVQWQHWVRDVSKSLRTQGPWLITTDAVSYFDTIRFDLLDRELQSIGVDQILRTTLRQMLQSWSPIANSGLIQGPDASRLLGNLYFAPIDAIMRTLGVGYFRYMDDIRIVAGSKGDAIRALRVLERECRARGLILSPTKTHLLGAGAAEDHDRDSPREQALYAFERGDYRRSRLLLRELLRDSIDDNGVVGRNAKFSLWRLSQLRDDSMVELVISRLDDLSPYASVVAEYLVPHITQPSVVRGISQYVGDPAAVRHEYLQFYLFALMLEHPGPLPPVWADYARTVMRDDSGSIDLRIIAANVVGLCATQADLAFLRRGSASEEDGHLARGFLIALARASSLDDATKLLARTRSAHLRGTVDHLETLASLPSLVSARRRIAIPTPRRA